MANIKSDNVTKYKGDNTFVVKVVNPNGDTKDFLYIKKEKDIIPTVKRRWELSKGWSVEIYIVYDFTRTAYCYEVKF